MSVPEASVNKNNGKVIPKYKVGRAREILHVGPEAQTHLPEDLANDQFWFCILRRDPAHIP